MGELKLYGEEREFCLAGDRDDSGSGILLMGEAKDNECDIAEVWKDVKKRHEV